MRVVSGLQRAKPGKAVAERSRYVGTVRVGFVIDVAPARVRLEGPSGVARPSNAAVLIGGVGAIAIALLWIRVFPELWRTQGVVPEKEDGARFAPQAVARGARG